MRAIPKTAKIHPAAKKCCGREKPAICGLYKHLSSYVVHMNIFSSYEHVSSYEVHMIILVHI